MVVEDDVYIHASLKELLETEGFAVDSAFNGEEAMNLLRAGRSPNLILLDLMMPRKDGFQFRVEQSSDPVFAKIPVIVMSAYGNLDRNKEQLKVEAYLKKPIDVTEFLNMVRQWCG